MRRPKQQFFIFNFIDGDRGDDSEAFIKDVLKHEQILNWAYVLHDNEYYNEHDMKSRYYGCQYCWADGFPGQEKYASMQEYIDEQMSKPPFAGDKKESRWHIFLITDGSVTQEEVADWFKMPGSWYLRDLTKYPSAIKDALESLTNEDHTAVSFERYRYPDDAVKANFNVREYMESIKIPIKRKWFGK